MDLRRRAAAEGVRGRLPPEAMDRIRPSLSTKRSKADSPGRASELVEKRMLESLKAVAETTGAAYFRAADTRALQSVYDKINKLEPSPAEVEQIVDHEELYRRFLIPGLALLFLQSLLSTTWLRRWP